MKRLLCTSIMCVLAAGLLAGCGGGIAGLRFAPSEEQKQAADLVVKDLHALQNHVTPAGEPIRREATDAAEVNQTYIGLPKTRSKPLAAENATALAQASLDAAREPTVIDVADTVLDEAAWWHDQLAPILLGLGIPGVAGIGLAIKRGKEIVQARRERDANQRSGTQIVSQNDAFMESPFGQATIKVDDQSITVAEAFKGYLRGQDGQTQAFVKDAKS